ncbi:Holliday junction DNA helicase RuvA [candidate division WOR-3 bacterium RBG_13_43_14]|uniref:Holliday junction branch migration complex subunit RuvA n=1 Tax=candidate division WOR-3 bacterium RBG_13_43_14 TaxID=1802590 RepID=A0A1F4UE12_UNCW3|nr:MAG: Holliday junction DNA helicase RuvA [candidate division WOR-3 bacterium RBG_13_43_14]
MIGRLRGTISDIQPPFLILDISGIGFSIEAPISLFGKIKNNQELTLYTKTRIKEDELLLYGFSTIEDLKLFNNLTSVTGVGPKSALNILGRFSAREIEQAIDAEDVELLASVPKVGKKIASKIVLDLKGKLTFAESSGNLQQAVNALCSLGLSRNEAQEKLKGLSNKLPVEELIKEALKK